MEYPKRYPERRWRALEQTGRQTQIPKFAGALATSKVATGPRVLRGRTLKRGTGTRSPPCRAAIDIGGTRTQSQNPSTLNDSNRAPVEWNQNADTLTPSSPLARWERLRNTPALVANWPSSPGWLTSWRGEMTGSWARPRISLTAAIGTPTAGRFFRCRLRLRRSCRRAGKT